MHMSYDISALSIEEKIDALGKLKAKISDLELYETDLKNALIKDVGIGAQEGKKYRCTISSSTREILDMEAVRKHLSPQFIRAHTKTSTSPVVRVTTVK
jgi:hypothetical protein